MAQRLLAKRGLPSSSCFCDSDQRRNGARAESKILSVYVRDRRFVMRMQFTMIGLIGLASAGLASIGTMATAMGEEAGVASVDPYAARKVFYEELWQSKIAAALQYVDGAVVSVDVKISPEVSRTVVTKEYGSNPVAEIESTEVAEKAEQEAGSSGDGKRSTTSESSFTKRLVSESQTTRNVAGLTPESVSVTVSVPRHYYATVLARRQQMTDGRSVESNRQEELMAIEQEVTTQTGELVRTLLPRGKSEDTRVRVISFDAIDRAVEAAPRVERAAKLKHPKILTVVFGEEVAGKQDGIRQASATDDETFRMAALVKGVDAYGDLQIESHQIMKNGSEEWRRDMSGKVRAEIVRQHGGEVSASEVADLRLKTMRVRVGVK
jgi:hypothetical protein